MLIRLPREIVREVLFWIVCAIIIILLVMMGGCLSTSAQQRQIQEMETKLQQQSEQVDKNSSGIKGNNNLITNNSTKINQTETNIETRFTSLQESSQSSIDSQIKEFKGKQINDSSQTTNNPWSFVVIIGILVIGGIALIVIIGFALSELPFFSKVPFIHKNGK